MRNQGFDPSAILAATTKSISHETFADTKSMRCGKCDNKFQVPTAIHNAGGFDSSYVDYLTSPFRSVEH